METYKIVYDYMGRVGVFTIEAESYGEAMEHFEYFEAGLDDWVEVIKVYEDDYLVWPD